MIPNNVLAVQTERAQYLPPDDAPTDNLTSYEDGGIGIQDPSQGLQVQTWTLTSDSQGVYLSAPNTPKTRLFTLGDIGAARGKIPGTPITEVSLAFDQNMRPFVAFVADALAGFWWFNSQTNTMTFTDLATDVAGNKALTPRCCLDDKRPRESGNSDIILAYVRANVLYFRMQRDRYGVEYQLMDNAFFTLDQVGMNRKGRLQFRVRTTT